MFIEECKARDKRKMETEREMELRLIHVGESKFKGRLKSVSLLYPSPLQNKFRS